MLDFNHILSTPGIDVQYFTGQGGIFGNLTPVTISTGGILGVPGAAVVGGYLVDQAITVSGTLSAGTINGTADYTTPVTFYILAATNSSVIISATPGGAAVATTAGTATPGGVFTLSSQWQTWRKPRGVKNVYMIGVGGGASGVAGANTAATNVGGVGGGSGGQTCVWIPAMFVPDVLYIQCGAGGKYSDTPVSGINTNAGGGPTYVAIEPSTTLTANMTLLLANGGQGGGTSGGVLATIAGMPLAARGYYTFFAGQAGTNGGAAGSGAGTQVTFPITGLMVQGGSGGGGGGNPTGGTGGSRSVPAGVPINDFFLPAQSGGTAASGATPAGAGGSGMIVRNFIMNYGGLGGGGASNTSGGVAGAGGNGAPGSGGGGSGGSTTVAGANTKAMPGNGGDGFVIIMSW